MHLIQIFGLRVVGLEIVIADRPGRRESAVVAQFAEIFFAQAEQRGAVKLGVAADVVVGVGMQIFAVFIKPGFFGVVVGVHVHELRIPVRLFARNVVATLENENPLSRRSQVIGEGSTTRAGSDNDYVVAIVGHDA